MALIRSPSIAVGARSVKLGTEYEREPEQSDDPIESLSTESGEETVLVEKEAGAYVSPCEACDIHGAVQAAERRAVASEERIQQLELQIAASANEEYAKGEADGFRRAENMFKEQAAEQNGLLERIVGELAAVRQNYEESLRNSVPIIVMEAVGKILGKSIATQKGVCAAVETAIGIAVKESRVKVKVSPKDFEILNRRTGGRAIQSVSELEVVSDESVVLGGCLLETELGSTDLRLETQLAELKDALVRARNRLNARRRRNTGLS